MMAYRNDEVQSSLARTESTVIEGSRILPSPTEASAIPQRTYHTNCL